MSAPSESKERSPAQNRLIYTVITALAVVATLFGLSNGRILGVTPSASVPLPGASSTPLNPVDAQPAPSLFKSTELTPISALLAPQLKRAQTSIDTFYDTQPTGSTVDDAAFVTWASRQVTSEPSTLQRRRELAQLTDLDRSNKATHAAQWLSLHGCRDVWTSYALEQQRFHPDDDQVATETELSAVIDLAARVTAATQRRLSDDNAAAPPAPCAPRTELDPTGCGCSFPSSAAAVSAAARTYLAALGGTASRQYAWMEQQVDMAAVYQGFELPSDVQAGAYLGYLVGEYFLASHGYATPTPTPTPTTAP